MKLIVLVLVAALSSLVAGEFDCAPPRCDRSVEFSCGQIAGSVCVNIYADQSDTMVCFESLLGMQINENFRLISDVFVPLDFKLNV